MIKQITDGKIHPDELHVLQLLVDNRDNIDFAKLRVDMFGLHSMEPASDYFTKELIKGYLYSGDRQAFYDLFFMYSNELSPAVKKKKSKKPRGKPIGPALKIDVGKF